MKKFIFTLAIAAAAISSHAQVDTENPVHLQNVYDLTYIPSSMSYNGKVYFVALVSGTSGQSFYIYDEKLKVIKVINDDIDIHVTYFGDLDNSVTCTDGDGAIYLTQSLFNNDEKYEFVVCNVGKCQIINEDGKILQELPYPNDVRLYIYKANGKFYFQVGDKYLYPINKNTTNGINPLGTPVKIKANPSLARRNQTIKVELGEDSEKARTVSVTNAAGQRVWHGTAQPGQKSVSIEAGRLGQGVNVVNVEGTTKTSSCKVIVR